MASEKPSNEMKQIQEFVKLNKKKKELEGALEGVKEEMDALRPAIMKYFEDNGVQSVKVNNGADLVYLKSQLWASKAKEVHPADLAKALKRCKLGDYIALNHQGLSGYVREVTEDAYKKLEAKAKKKGTILEIEMADFAIKQLPKALRDKVSVYEKKTITAKKG